MNVNEYISSGILEQYVSGLISPQEKQEVECMSHIYPEIQDELNTLYATFEAIALEMKRTPPAHLKASVMSALNDLKNEDLSLTASPLVSASIPEETPVTQHPTTGNVRTMQTTGWIRIAASVLLLLTVSFGYLLYNKSKDADQLQQEIALQKESKIKAETALATLSKQVEVMSNERYQKINLSGIPEKSPASSVAIYWNKTSSEVFIANINLPAPPSDKQYQLWAIADGKPVDIGMIENNQSPVAVFQ
ncbi:MAG: anti-sigma factor [Chitinophagaceae bacterium]|nr:anti-sigma factor [Chitinophagaceae bacterium]